MSAQPELRVAAAGRGVRRAGGALRQAAARPAGGRFDRLADPESGEMHPVRALRGGLPADAGGLGAGIHRARRKHAHRAGGGCDPQRIALHPVRPVLGALPGGRNLRAQPRPGSLCGAGGPEEALRGADCPGGARGPGRGFRLCARHAADGQDLLGPATPRIQRGVRHQFRRRPHHHGRGFRVRRTLRARQGRAAADHQLLPVVDRLHGKVRAGLHCALLDGQVAAGDGRGAGEDLLRQADRAGSQGHLRGLHHALHGQEVRNPAQRGNAQLRPAGHRLLADDARAVPDDQERRH